MSRLSDGPVATQVSPPTTTLTSSTGVCIVVRSNASTNSLGKLAAASNQTPNSLTPGSNGTGSAARFPTTAAGRLGLSPNAVPFTPTMATPPQQPQQPQTFSPQQFAATQPFVERDDDDEDAVVNVAPPKQQQQQQQQQQFQHQQQPMLFQPPVFQLQPAMNQPHSSTASDDAHLFQQGPVIDDDEELDDEQRQWLNEQLDLTESLAGSEGYDYYCYDDGANQEDDDEGLTEEERKWLDEQMQQQEQADTEQYQYYYYSTPHSAAGVQGGSFMPYPEDELSSENNKESKKQGES